VSAFVIATNTFRETIRDRLMAGVLAAGAVLLVVTQIATPLALGEGRRLTVDLGLSAISLLGLFVVVLVGTSLVAKELDRRTIYNLLSRPIARPVYLLGKWLGITAALAVLAGALGAALGGLLTWRGWMESGLALAQSVYLAGLELAVVAAIAVMFSALSTPVLSALYTLGLYAAGQWSDDLRAFASHAPPALARLIHVFADLVPNLPLFNMRTLVADGRPTTALHLGLATAYAATYVTCVLALGAAAFERKDFK